jgi:hypothetical protein
MRTWKVVGWFADDPLDTIARPIPFTLTVKATCRSDASDFGYTALQKQHPEGELLNWYVEPAVVR